MKVIGESQLAASISRVHDRHSSRSFRARRPSPHATPIDERCVRRCAREHERDLAYVLLYSLSLIYEYTHIGIRVVIRVTIRVRVYVRNCARPRHGTHTGKTSALVCTAYGRERERVCIEQSQPLRNSAAFLFPRPVGQGRATFSRGPLPSNVTALYTRTYTHAHAHFPDPKSVFMGTHDDIPEAGCLELESRRPTTSHAR